MRAEAFEEEPLAKKSLFRSSEQPAEPATEGVFSDIGRNCSIAKLKGLPSEPMSPSLLTLDSNIVIGSYRNV